MIKQDGVHLPAENTENEVEHEERTDDNKTDKINPRPAIAHRIVNLHSKKCSN
jgi:hypothetical protein